MAQARMEAAAMRNETGLSDAAQLALYHYTLQAYWDEQDAREAEYQAAMQREEEVHYQRLQEQEWEARQALEHAEPAVAVHEDPKR
ncbi:MAG TPA: hypothetical protein VFB99_24440 [Vicinamibacterales bacterium]|nr:hypothetical protein [Vicinamibacterales bacterium]